MAQLNADGYFDIRVNQDKTQAFVDVFPPQGGGRNITTSDITSALEKKKIAYGIRHETIGEATAKVAANASPVMGVLAAQGIMPENGTDSQIVWRIDTDIASKPLPKRADGLPDYFQIDTARFVKAGQELAIVVPGLPGKAGKTLIAPFEIVKQAPGRDVPVMVGEGVKLTSDRLKYLAEVDGVVTFHNDKLKVHAMSWVEGDLIGGEHTFQSVVVMGRMDGATVNARGFIAVRGMVKQSNLRAHGHILVCNTENTQMISDNDIYVDSLMKDSVAITPANVFGAPGSVIAGGQVCAAKGILAYDLGSTEWQKTEISLEGKTYNQARSHEIECEMRTTQENVVRIGVALKPLASVTAEPMSEVKRKMVQTLMDQKRELEQRGRDLHGEKRTIQMMNYPETGKIQVAGTIHPGVNLNVYGVHSTVEEGISEITYSKASSGKELNKTPYRKAA